MTCGHILQAAHDTIVNEGIRRTHDKLEAWFAGEHVTMQDVAINCLMLGHAPAFDHLISDPWVIGWSQRLPEAMRHHFQETLTVEASSSLPPPPLNSLTLAVLWPLTMRKQTPPSRTYKPLPWKRPSATLGSGNPPLSCLGFRQKKPRLALRAHQELSAFQHALKVESNERKEAVCLKTAKGITLISKSEPRGKRKADAPTPSAASLAPPPVPHPAPEAHPHHPRPIQHWIRPQPRLTSP